MHFWCLAVHVEISVRAGHLVIRMAIELLLYYKLTFGNSHLVWLLPIACELATDVCNAFEWMRELRVCNYSTQVA